MSEGQATATDSAGGPKAGSDLVDMATAVVWLAAVAAGAVATARSPAAAAGAAGTAALATGGALALADRVGARRGPVCVPYADACVPVGAPHH